MKKTIVIIIITLLVLLTTGVLLWQYTAPHSYKLLLRADTLMTTRPDSALKVLQSIKKPQSLSGENEALYALLTTQARYKNHIPVENDSLIRIAVDYYAGRNDSLRKAWSYFYMAQVCRDMKDKKNSLDYFQKAAIAAERSDNYKLLDLLYFYWGELLQGEQPYEEGLSKLMKAKEYGEMNKDTLSIIYSLKDIGRSYVWKGDYKAAEEYFLKAIKLSEQSRNKLLHSTLYQQLGMCHRQNKQFAKALECINKATSLSHDETALKGLYPTKSIIYCDLRQYDSARYYIERCDNESDLYSIAYYQYIMSRIEEGVGNYPEALKWSRLYSSYKDSIESYEKNNNLIELQKKYDYTLVQNENIILKNKNQAKNITTLIIVIILILILFTSYYIYNKMKKKKERIIENKDKLLDESQKQLQQKTNELLQNKQTVEDKEAELEEYYQKEQSLRKNIIIQKEKLDFYMQQQQNLKEQIFRMGKIAIRIEKINTLAKLQKDRQAKQLKLTQEELDELSSAIDCCYSDFTKRLHSDCPSLNDMDIYICCLLKMDVKSQDIGYLLDISDETLKKRKYRIKKEKLGINQDISLENYLKNY